MRRENDGRTGKEEEAATMEGEAEEEAGEVNGGEKTATMERKTAMKWTTMGDTGIGWRGDVRAGKEKTKVGRRSRRRLR
nr:hypothetical protein Iba_chr06cCG8440 [Ipomoea batatas]GMD10519.1 hypothetical protein Iba_chr06eCG7040 [Ipomoea batatas]